MSSLPISRNLPIDESNVKRFRPSVPGTPNSDQFVIDLTNEDEDEDVADQTLALDDTEDSSDDDDVMITGMRTVSRPKAFNVQRPVPATIERLDSLEAPSRSQSVVPQVNGPKPVPGLIQNQHQPKPVPGFIQNLPQPQTQPHSFHQTTQQDISQRNNGAFPLNRQHLQIRQPQTTQTQPKPEPTLRKFVKWNGIPFREERDVDAKEKELKEKFEGSQRALKHLIKQIDVLIENHQKENQGPSSLTYNPFSENKAFQDLFRMKPHMKEKLEENRRQFLNFVNQARPQILSTLRKLRDEERVKSEKLPPQAPRPGASFSLDMNHNQIQGQLQRPSLHEQLHQQQQHGNAGIFSGMVDRNNSRPARMVFDGLDDDDFDSEDDGYYDDGDFMDPFGIQGDPFLRNNRNNRDPFDPYYNEPSYQRNIYNDNAEDLRSFLESIKTIEDSIEGESNTPDDLTVNLMKHQRMGLHWLELNERDEKKKGGILADAMGLGKTVQAISLMLSRRAGGDDDCKTNLIVCPVAMMRQWESEINTKVKESAGLSTFIFHPSSGARRITSFNQLAKFDVVLISYQTLASEMKKHIHGYDLKDMGIRRINQLKENSKGTYFSPFFEPGATFYRVILDEAHWIKNKLTKASISCWLLEANYRWCLSGTPMQNNVEEIFPLIRFLRIRPYCNEQKFRDDISVPLKSKTGHYDEMDRDQSMKKVRILLKAILLRRSKDSQVDGKPLLVLPPKEVMKEEVDMSDNMDEKVFYDHLESRTGEQVQQLLNKGLAKGNYSSILTLLLRLRQACLHSELVRIGERKQGITFDDEGKIKKQATWEMMYSFAKSLKPEVIRRINNASSDEKDVDLKGKKNEEDAEEDEGRFQCPICLDNPPDSEWVMFSPCGHGLCEECVEGFFDKFQENDGQEVRSAKCTQCRLVVKETHMFSFEMFDNVCNKNQSKAVIKLLYEKNKEELKKINEAISQEVKNLGLSPKFKKALELIQKIMEENPGEKIIFFSQFTTTFDIFSKFLEEKQIKSLRYDGSMKADDRNNVIKEFYKNPDYRLLMISLKAGNVGLTLTCANHVIIMDPFWNPYVEEQAQDRAHRIGQEKRVNIYRLLAKGTVEDRIMQLQDQKKELVESALDEQGMKSAGGLGRNEIEFLFNLR